MLPRKNRSPGMMLFSCFLFAVFFLPAAVVSDSFHDLPGPYCATRYPTCCPGREDKCSVPILGTLCYCDMFCDRTYNGDCCPDFRPVCLGEVVKPEPLKVCIHEGKSYSHNKTVKFNCNYCTCQETSVDRMEMVCDSNPCLIREEIIDAVNRERFGWRASNYSFFWGKTLEEGVSQRLGAFRPEQLVAEMSSVDMNGAKVEDDSFDAREKWPGLIQPVSDQGDCASSWAVSTADVASDRLAIMTNGEQRHRLSAQELLSCHNDKQKGCLGGYTDRAWRFLNSHGVVSDECYPYTSAHRGHERSGKGPKCEVQLGSEHLHCPSGFGDTTIYKTPPPYRIGSSERDIRVELRNNGPVQALVMVREDFYMYQSGVYRYANLFPKSPISHRRSGLHAVRILGWGVDRSQGHADRYWLCANSWGRQWGEDGLFRIARGEDESGVEAFVVSVWANEHDLLIGKDRGATTRRPRG